MVVSLAENRFSDPNRGEAVEHSPPPLRQKTRSADRCPAVFRGPPRSGTEPARAIDRSADHRRKIAVALFERAAQRAGLEVQAIKRPLAEIPALVLPAVLVMRDGTTRILLANHADPERATVIDPSSADPHATATGARYCELSRIRVLRPSAPTADPRTMAAGEVPRDHWFWSVVRHSGRTTATSRSRHSW